MLLSGLNLTAETHILIFHRLDVLLSLTLMASGASFLHPSQKTTQSPQPTPRSPRWPSPTPVPCSMWWWRTTTPTTSTMTLWTQTPWSTPCAQKTPSSLRWASLPFGYDLPIDIISAYSPCLQLLGRGKQKREAADTSTKFRHFAICIGDWDFP